MIYLDHAATTPLRDEARAVLAEFAASGAPFANASSSHGPGRAMARRVAKAREEFAALIDAPASDIIWTSGATEANNIAILGHARYACDLGRQIVVPRTEHKAVISPVRHLVSQGFKACWLDPVVEGVCQPGQFADAVNDQTVLACAMAVNNETGVRQDIASIAEVCAGAGVALHVDAAQALGKDSVSVVAGVGSMSFSAHKLGGPPGVGALYLRSRPSVGVQALQYGGGQERGIRPGTLPPMLILAFVAAAVAACQRQEEEQRYMSELRERLWITLRDALPGVRRNSPQNRSSAHVLNLSFSSVHGESLRAMLPELAVSSGSACSSAQAESSYVLRALGYDDAQADASLRFSLSPGTSEAEVDAAACMVIDAVNRLRAREIHRV